MGEEDKVSFALMGPLEFAYRKNMSRLKDGNGIWEELRLREGWQSISPGNSPFWPLLKKKQWYSTHYKLLRCTRLACDISTTGIRSLIYPCHCSSPLSHFRELTVVSCNCTPLAQPAVNSQLQSGSAIFRFPQLLCPQWALSKNDVLLYTTLDIIFCQ